MVVVYDITSEKTFLNAREWLDSAVDGTDKAALMLLGNKLDLAQDDLMRCVCDEPFTLFHTKLVYLISGK